MTGKPSNRVEAYWHDAVEELFAHPEKTIKQVAQERQMNAHTLGAYILNHYRERWEEFCREERHETRGRRSTRAERYEQAAVYIREHPEEILESVAHRFGIYSSTPMAKYIRYHYPDLLPWRTEWNKAKTKVKKRRLRRAEIEESKRIKEEEKKVEKAKLDAAMKQAREYAAKRRAWRLAELDAPVVPFAERMEAMQKRLNDIRDGRGDTFNPGDLPLIKITPGGYSVAEWQKKQHTLDIIMRRMEQVKRMRGKG